MYKKILLGGALMVSLICGASAQQAVTGCAAKKLEIEKQLSYAHKHNNPYQVAGLEKALKEVSLNCTDTKLSQKLSEKVSDKQDKVSERAAELKEAQAKGDPRKIAKKIEKLNEAKRELDKAKVELKTLSN